MCAGSKAGFLASGGELAKLILARDWASTPLGPIDDWPESLRTTVSLCLASNFPINIIWGPGHVQIYSEGYAAACGDAHPAALGQDYRVTWATAWPAIGDPFERALAGKTSFLENQQMFVNRNGYLEETFFTYSLSPIRDEAGDVAGLFHPVAETTAVILAERRTRALRELTSNLAEASDAAEIMASATATLAPYRSDLPFLLFYELCPASGAYRPALADGAPVDASVWDFAGAVDGPGIAERTISAVFGGTADFSALAFGPYPEPPVRGFVVPLRVPGTTPPLIVVAGASSRLPLDDSYRGFFDLLATVLSAAMVRTRARHDEARQREALARLDRAKTNFFANVSHEFRTPLALILSPLEEAMSAGNALDIDSVTSTHRNALRLLKLVNTLLDFSRIESGMVEASYEATDLAAYTTELASHFHSAIGRAGLELIVDAPPLPDAVYVDRDMWEKIVLNLLSNAFKFTFTGTIGVKVRAAADGETAEIVIADTGTGIPTEELPRLFERFHRVEGAEGRSHEGSGIGLALVHELVRLHGGTITVTSELRHGTTFVVSLPFGTAHLPPGRIAGAGSSHSMATQVSGATRADAFVGEALQWLPETATAAQEAKVALLPPDAWPMSGTLGGRVLLADDNADMRAYVKRLLVAEGLTVEAVANGAEALAAARRTPPDLILSDVMMPGIDGFALLRELRGDPALAETPVILLSSRAGPEAKVEGLLAGADNYLVKPFSARELVARVSNSLNLARDRRDAVLVRSEQELRRLNETLEARVAERNAELAAVQDDLRQSQKLEAMGQLTGGVAHDFNNLLTPIIGSLDLLQRRGTGDVRERRLIEGALASAERAKVVVQRLLAFARRQPLAPVAVDLSTLIRGMAELLESTLGPRVGVVVEIGGDVASVQVDPNQLEMAILNLGVNARDAMAAGGTLTITAAEHRIAPDHRSKLPPGDYVCLSIADTGCGMDEATLAKAIEPFFSTKGIGKGTGLGLSMVHGLASQLGGSLTLSSKLGLGSVVELWLPLSPLPAALRRLVPGRRERPFAGTVLLVDDEELVRASTADMLAELGCDVVEARSAEEALGLVAKGLRPGLLITDQLMAGVHGTELAYALRLRWPELPVLIVSGYADFDSAGHGFDQLAKPFRVQDLAASIVGLTHDAEARITAPAVVATSA